MLGHLESEDHVAHLRVARLFLGDEFEIGGADAAVVAVLDQEAAGD
jgi:hypothetical protein